MKKFGIAIAGFLLLASALSALAAGGSDVRMAESSGQRLTAWSDLVFGVAGLVAFLGLLFRRRWVRPPLLIWAAFATVAATTAPITWGGSSVAVGVVTGLVALLVTVSVVVALLRWVPIPDAMDGSDE